MAKQQAKGVSFAESPSESSGAVGTTMEAVLDRMEHDEPNDDGKSSNVTVAVRSRPLNAREKAAGCDVVVRMDDGQQVEIFDPKSDKKNRFGFDYAYWSTDHEGGASKAPFCSQQTVFNDIGVGLLVSAWHGFNVTVFAYGQTGAGKSYTITGDADDDVEAGIVPRVCFCLFAMVDRMHKRAAPLGAAQAGAKVEVSFLEIYNEKIRDLLAPGGSVLKIRELKRTGVIVQGLHKSAVHNFEELRALMDEGNQQRTIAATNMNAVSSRSHSIFTIELCVVEVDSTSASQGRKRERKSVINLCDLAGSERAERTGATGARLKEGAGINASLSKLGRCISMLAQVAGGKGNKKAVVPFRESKLTYLLKNSLSGNAKTFMFAAISPSDDSYSETLSTLRYASQTKLIKTKAVKNVTPTEKLIHDLRAEIERLKQAAAGRAVQRPSTTARREDAIQAYQAQVDEMEMSWDDKRARSEQVRKQRQSHQGFSVEEITGVFDVDKDTPHLINLSEDAMSLHEMLVYFLKGDGVETVVGSDKDTDITLDNSAGTIKPTHCKVCRGADDDGRGGITIETLLPDAQVHVNGEQVRYGETRPLNHNARVVLGETHFFRFVNPCEARKSSVVGASSIGVVDARALMEEMAKAEATRIVKARRLTMKLRQADDKAEQFQQMVENLGGDDGAAHVQQIDTLLSRANQAEAAQARALAQVQELREALRRAEVERDEWRQKAGGFTASGRAVEAHQRTPAAQNGGTAGQAAASASGSSGGSKRDSMAADHASEALRRLESDRDAWRRKAESSEERLQELQDMLQRVRLVDDRLQSRQESGATSGASEDGSIALPPQESVPDYSGVGGARFLTYTRPELFPPEVTQLNAAPYPKDVSFGHSNNDNRSQGGGRIARAMAALGSVQAQPNPQLQYASRLPAHLLPRHPRRPTCVPAPTPPTSLPPTSLSPLAGRSFGL